MKKKVLSVILIITMLLLPFSMLLNVKAVTENGVTYNDNITKIGDSSSFLATDTANIEVTSINAGDTFKAYKVLDAYYNPTKNVFSYQFTGDANSPKTDFASFVATLTTADIEYITGVNGKTTFTVDDYLALSSDYTSSTGNNTESNSTSTSSTLNKLISKYAAYIRANASAGLSMTAGTGSVNLANASAGAYLILPDSVMTAESTENIFSQLLIHTYGVVVANVFYTAGTNNTWTLPNRSIMSKYSNNIIMDALMPISYSDLSAITDPQQQAEIMSHSGSSTNIDSGQTFSIINVFTGEEPLPTNTHDSIKNNQAVTDLLTYSEVSIPAGFSFDLDNSIELEGSALTKEGDNCYYGENLIIESVSSSKIKVYNVDSADGVMTSIVASNSYAFTAGEANTITVTKYYIKDPYVDIGSNVTVADIETALAASRDNAIKKAIGVIKHELSVYIYGLKINNKNTSNTNLSGGVFQTYSDSDCAAGTEIGPSFTVENGVGSFVGISGYNKVYLKQIQAPTGYKLYDKIIDVTPVTNENPNQGQAFTKSGVKVKRLEAPAGHVEMDAILQGDKYYTLSMPIINEATGYLPFTGGIGTIIFTAVGLLVVLGAVIFLLVYKKKDKKDK